MLIAHQWPNKTPLMIENWCHWQNHVQRRNKNKKNMHFSSTLCKKYLCAHWKRLTCTSNRPLEPNTYAYSLNIQLALLTSYSTWKVKSDITASICVYINAFLSINNTTYINVNFDQGLKSRYRLCFFKVTSCTKETEK